MKKEIISSIKNVFFILPLTFFCILVVVHCYTTVLNYYSFINSLTESDKAHGNCCFPVYTSFNMWIGRDDSKYAKILFYVAPFLAALPYSWSHCRDIKKNHILIKSEYKTQYISKLVGVFISSGLLIAIPLFINFIGISIFVPSITPDSVYDFYYHIFSNNFIGELFYTNPYLYITFYIMLNFIIYGLLGCVGLSFSTIFNSKYMSVLIPIMFIFFIEVMKIILCQVAPFEISLLEYMYPFNSLYDNETFLFLEILILIFLVSIFSRIGVKSIKNEN